MIDLMNKTLSEIVTDNHRAAPIFEKYGLDFCCKGKRPLKTACADKEVDTNGNAYAGNEGSDERAADAEIFAGKYFFSANRLCQHQFDKFI